MEMERVQHPFHDHPLVIVSQENRSPHEQYSCSGCSAPILLEPIFVCSLKCGFTLHKSCAESPMEINHFLHTQHPLVLQVKSTPEFRSNICDHCKNTIKGFLYRCSICESPILSGPIFICSKQQQCKFMLHKSCAELPMEITHRLHNSHPLTLLGKSPYESGPPYCDKCGDAVKDFVYNCSICKFDLDVLCASLKSIYTEPPEKEDHKHKLVVVKPSAFACDICGKEERKGKSYLCITCQLRAHPTCSFLPIRVKFFTHSCPLKLTFGHQLETPIEKIKQYCGICLQKLVDDSYGFYYCVECKYIADIRCALVSELRDYQFDAETYSPTRRYIDEGKIDLQNWHEHGLILCKDEPATINTTDGQVLVCRGCVSDISSGPFYECKEKCGYVLDESCANLYEKIRRPRHCKDHGLVLLDRGPFGCYWCELQCCGFGYFCIQEGCKWPNAIDTKCALRPDVIERAHQHRLRKIKEGGHYNKTCKGCSSRCYEDRYSCPDCDYNLCYGCVGLPTSAKHRWDEHPLMLTYESTPHEDGEYYCDECEKPRDQDHLFYHCAICERDVHTECMGLHNLDLTLTYGLEESHPGHKLIMVANPQFYPTCTTCGLPCKDIYYQCQDCEFCRHYWPCTPLN